MNAIFERFFKNLVVHGLEYFGLFYGHYRGICMDNKDPKKQGRIRVKVPCLTGDNIHPEWAWPIALWAGKDSGLAVLPDEGDPVYVTFENGNKNFPQWDGGWWPSPDSGNYMMEVYNTEGVPTKRIFKTKAGHELSFEDDPLTQSVKLVWHDKTLDKYSFIAFTKDGSVQWANHKGCFVELRAKDGDERIMMMDASGNLFTQDKDGTKVVDKFGNFIELKEKTIQLVGTENVIVNAKSINLKAGGVSVGDVTTDDALKGTTFYAWLISVFKTWASTHTHPTGVGPSGPSPMPLEIPASEAFLTKKLKMQ